MNKFAENNPERLKAFAVQLEELMDEFHPNIYLIDEVYAGVELILTGIQKKLKEDEI
jgi:Holliday junction resolvasome RuvABC endonuclease subunit